ncbi:GSCFA domain-containing protein [Novosphingobium cyanobacteriorum]|uniref:GSCFA domain-containing protein n=1 Tax=Novosphingobium cyanobacteriorum TaxID=3024215 RepID=A0ABT6CIZ1_9SPHN|nr:GSCFA domain-containing protein [Novosphingobium cyanobacteriorum]MDF8333045.1 GSCFA domain-containing protein [Novosphingobium cyanobacteriorum]
MPRFVPLDQALARARENRFGRMLGRGAENRVEPECWPHIAPSFRFDRSAKFFAIGSCFAANITRRLILDGYDMQTGGEPLELHHNRYTPPAIWQELAWAGAIFHRDDTPTDNDILPLLIELTPGRWADLWCREGHRTDMTREEAIAARQALYAHFRHAFTADVVIVTLGLIEAWWDSVSRSYVEFDTAWARRADRDRLSFVRLDFATCLDFVVRTMELLCDGRRKVLLTTSPVVLARTFTADDIVVANTHSKAVLRAVAGEVADRFADVDYFPSYEIATITRKAEVREDDLVHVAPGFVARIMDHVTAAYGEGAAQSGEDAEARGALLRMAALVEAQRLDEAWAILDPLAERDVALGGAAAHAAAMRLLWRRGVAERALDHARVLGVEAEALVGHQPEWVMEAGCLLESGTGAGDGALAEAAFAAVLQAGRRHPVLLVQMLQRLRRAECHEVLLRFAALMEELGIDHPEAAGILAPILCRQDRAGQAEALCRAHLQQPRTIPRCCCRWPGSRRSGVNTAW